MSVPTQTLVPITTDFLKGDPNARILIKLHGHAVPQRGVSKDLFEHTLVFLGALRCWKSDETSQPWETIVRYTVLPSDVIETPREPNTEITIESDDRGETKGLVVHREPSSVRVRIGEAIYATVSLSLRDSSKRFLRKDTGYNNVVIERRKSFSFTSSSHWIYTLCLRWCSPSNASIVDASGSYIDTTSLIFANTPTFHILIECCPPCLRPDAAYLAESIMCKIGDLLPPYMKVQSTVSTMPVGAAGGEEVTDMMLDTEDADDEEEEDDDDG